MATPSLLIPLFSLFLLIYPFSFAQQPPNPKAFVFPVRKDDGATNQYYTTVTIGSNATTFSAVIDLGGKMMYFNSLDYFNAASTYRPILCGTRQCRIANGVGCIFCFLSPPVPGCTNNTCSDYALNPFTGTQGYAGLGQDTLHVYSTRGDRYRVDGFPFQFSDPVLREGLAAPTAGLIGLGRTKIALQAQLASAFKIREKIALCMPSSGSVGSMIIGETDYAMPFRAIASSLYTTPLVKNPVSTDMNEVIGNLTVEYFIGVKSIKVGNRALNLNKTLLSINRETGAGGTGIRTVRAYTRLHRSIYDALIREFVNSATAKNIRRVASVAPFGACFDSSSIGSSATGLNVPEIDFVLQNDVYWRFYGANSMVRVSDGVMCLAFVDGTPNLTGPTTSIVVGGYQMENHLLEFDVASSKLRFSSSLLLRGTSCSQFRAA
ncbi:probable aspartic proteinase GIP2 [Andrographis paniculata]|uniref:probable aspartic proteinase GIP2 n=1 Tax=Andrographis paniculata TaxID=175694 RepID=UPI0021E780B1|nr:probable aspartic proteinase GIP2 [Andrographis paniculata]